MLTYGLAVPLLLIVAAVAPDAPTERDRAALAARPEHASQPGVGEANGRVPRIKNDVLDLLDREIALDSTTAQTTWESRPFDTAQYNRVGIRVSTREGSDPVVCSLWWQFTPDEEFLPGPPVAAPTPIGDDRVLNSILAPIGFGQVFGLRARAVCQLIPNPDFGRPDPPPPTSAVVSDVKVLLRLE